MGRCLEAALPALLNCHHKFGPSVLDCPISSGLRSLKSTSFTQLLMEGATIDAFNTNSFYIHVFCRQHASARCPKKSLAGAGGPWDMGLQIPFRDAVHPPWGTGFSLNRHAVLVGALALMDWSQEEHGCLGHCQVSNLLEMRVPPGRWQSCREKAFTKGPGSSASQCYSREVRGHVGSFACSKKLVGGPQTVSMLFLRGGGAGGDSSNPRPGMRRALGLMHGNLCK